MCRLIIPILLGTIVGTFTGLIPGIHINLVGSILTSSDISSQYYKESIIIFIISMSITHTFLDFIPSIFLGVPDEDTLISTLPGHKMVLQGRGYEAVYLTSVGSLIAVPIILLLSALLVNSIIGLKPILYLITPIILIISSLFLIFINKNKKEAFIVFLLTSFLGIASLNIGIKEPLLPLLSGLFGASSLIVTLKVKTKIPTQFLSKPNLKGNLKRPVFLSFLFPPLCCIFPALGSGQAIAISSSFSKLNIKEFLIMVGITNTLIVGLSFFLVKIGNISRTGVAVSVSSLLSSTNELNLYLVGFVIIFSSILSFMLCLFITKIICKKINKIDYSKLSLITLIFLSIFVVVFSGFIGFLIFLISSILGIYCILLKVRRITLMGCLLVPSIIFYISM